MATYDTAVRPAQSVGWRQSTACGLPLLQVSSKPEQIPPDPARGGAAAIVETRSRSTYSSHAAQQPGRNLRQPGCLYLYYWGLLGMPTFLSTARAFSWKELEIVAICIGFLSFLKMKSKR
jgi:hypothetical protein